MRDNNAQSCEHCGKDLFQLDGEWFCESCDSVSGFELTPEQVDFEL